MVEFIESWSTTPLSFTVAMSYMEGDGVPQSNAEAHRLCRLAANQSHPIAMYILSTRYREGKGVVQDEVEANRWLYLAEEPLRVQMARLDELDLQQKDF